MASLPGRISFKDLQRNAQALAGKYQLPLDITNVSKIPMPPRMTDTTAMMLLAKEDIKEDIRPIKTLGDGNCLFNGASLELCNSNVLLAELRLRTALELLLHADFYGDHPLVTTLDLRTRSGAKWSKEGIYDTVIFSNDASKILATKGFQTTLREEICATLHDGRFSGILQIMGLASATGCEIKMVYPDKRHSLFSMLNAIYQPRSGGSPTPRMTTMWTNTSGWPDRTKEFKVNHFVVMMRVDSQNNGWINVTRRRHLEEKQYNSTKKRSCSNQDVKASVKLNTARSKASSTVPNTTKSSASNFLSSRKQNGPSSSKSSKSRSETTSSSSPPPKHAKIDSRPFNSPGTHHSSPQSSPSTPHVRPKGSPVIKNASRTTSAPSTPNIRAQSTYASSSSNHLSSSTISNHAREDPVDKAEHTLPSSYTSTDSDQEKTFPIRQHESKETHEGFTKPNISVSSTHASSNLNHLNSSVKSSPARSDPEDDSEHSFPSDQNDSNEPNKNSSTPNICGPSTHAASNIDHLSSSSASSPSVENRSPVASEHEDNWDEPHTRDSDHKTSFLSPYQESKESDEGSSFNSALPLTAMGRSFYEKRGKLYLHNAHRRSKTQEANRTSSKAKNLLACRQGKKKEHHKRI